MAELRVRLRTLGPFGLQSDSSNSGNSSNDESDLAFTDSDSEQQHILTAEILHEVLNRGEMHILASDYIRQHPNRNLNLPKIKFVPNTTVLDKSEYALLTQLASGISVPRRKVMDVKNVTKLLINRELGSDVRNCGFSTTRKRKVANLFLPTDGQSIDSYIGKVFCGVYSKSGNRFITASQDRRIRIYKTDRINFQRVKKVRARDVGWSIIDVAFSPDEENFVYSTWSSSLHVCSVNDDSEIQEPINLLNSNNLRFCIFSVVFSADGKELLGGANDGCLYIWNRTSQDCKKINAHEFDVNSVAFADESSNIVYSAGDDGLVKVWDQRELKESLPKPVGILAGHMDGITYLDSRQDARHLITNSKDQSVKLWDIRKFSGSAAQEKSLKAVHKQNWDYRWQDVPKKLFNTKEKIEGDTSIMTYRGHVVVKTLIRCRFSPLETTGQRYIYTGCGLGQVVVYDSLTGEIAAKYQGHKDCVRDVSWHPYRPEIISSGWDGNIRKWWHNGYVPEVKKPKKKVQAVNENRQLRRSLRIASLNRERM